MEPNNDRQHLMDHTLEYSFRTRKVKSLPAAAVSQPPYAREFSESEQNGFAAQIMTVVPVESIVLDETSIAYSLRDAHEDDTANKSTFIAALHDPATCWWCLRGLTLVDCNQDGSHV